MRKITYHDAVAGFSKVLCNNIPEVDPGIFENSYGIKADKDGGIDDIFQFFLTDIASEKIVEYLVKRYELKFMYSDLLDNFVLCVDHFGTDWNTIPWVDNH